MPDPQQQQNATQDGAPIAPPPVGEQTTAQAVMPTLPGLPGFPPVGATGLIPGGVCGDGRPLVAGGWPGGPFAGGPTLWSGGTFGNPCGFPGWGTGYGGTYWTYAVIWAA